MNSAEIIRTVRERAGLTRYQLEKKAGLSPGHVTRFEKYGVSPRTDRFIAIINACGYEIVIKPKYSEDYAKKHKKGKK